MFPRLWVCGAPTLIPTADRGVEWSHGASPGSDLHQTQDTALHPQKVPAIQVIRSLIIIAEKRLQQRALVTDEAGLFQSMPNHRRQVALQARGTARLHLC